MANVRIFTKSGVDAVTNAIDKHLTGMKKGVHGFPIDTSAVRKICCLVDDESHLEPDTLCIRIDPSKEFESSLELGKYLCDVFVDQDFNSFSSGLWTWIAMLYFKQLLKKDKNGQYLLLSSYRYVLNEDSRLRYYRHLVYMPFNLYSKLQNDAYIFLRSPVYEAGDFLEQAQKAEVISNRNLIAMCEKYFFDRNKGSFAPGFTSTQPKDHNRSLRGLVQAIVPQLRMNYDMRFCDADELFQLLPETFRANSFINIDD